MNYLNEIKKLKKEKNAVILAHYYQKSEIQDIADFLGDSLLLSQIAERTKEKIIVFAGVLFMAETAKILNPDKKVIIPDKDAGCSLADTCKYEDLREFKKNNPEYKIVAYINCTARVKTLADIICTSSNAEKIIQTFKKNEKILFVPDKNLGAYLQGKLNRKMKLWNGSCHVHDQLKEEEIVKMKINSPNAKIIAHPECKSTILKIADFIGSTTALLQYTVNDHSDEYIVATETGIIHQMKKKNPGKKFYIVSSNKSCNCNDCFYMKMNTLEKIYICLKNESPEICLSDDILTKARIPLEKMLSISN